MGTKTRFSYIIGPLVSPDDGKELRALVQPAIDAAAAAYNDGKGVDKRGIVIAQVHIMLDGGVRLVGDFIEHEYAKPIFDALQERAAAKKQGAVYTK